MLWIIVESLTLIITFFSDYDAPLTEAGHYTAKYDKAAEMIAGDNSTKYW